MSDTSAKHSPAGTVTRQRRTGWDVVLGVLLIIGGVVILGNVVVATAVSVLLLGWTALLAGVVMLVGSLWRIKSGGFWSAALGGVCLTVLGVFVLRNPLVGAFSLTLLAGSLFLTAGLVRIFASGQYESDRWFIVLSGLVSVGLGVFVLLNLVTATLTLLGILLGVQTLIEGITLIVAGRVRPAATAAAARA